MNPLIDVAGLQARLAEHRRTVLLDVRWVLGDPHGYRHYLQGHLPGAVFVDLATELAAPAVPERGRHPLPAARDFQESARRWGIRDGDVDSRAVEFGQRLANLHLGASQQQIDAEATGAIERAGHNGANPVIPARRVHGNPHRLLPPGSCPTGGDGTTRVIG